MIENSVLACNAGTLHLFHLSEELLRVGLLRQCVTSLYFPPDAFRWLPDGLRSRAETSTANRSCAALAGKVRTWPVPEAVHLMMARLGVGSAAAWIEWRNRVFGRWAGRHCLEGVDLVWSFDTSSLEVFEAAKDRGLRCILDMSTLHPSFASAIMEEQAKACPQFLSGANYRQSEANLARRTREMELADCLVVASSFAAESLVREGMPPERIRLNPYGVDLSLFGSAKRSGTSSRAPSFLFVSWFSEHKGVYHLLDAWSQSGLGEIGATLRLAGGQRKDLSRWHGPLPIGVEILGRVPHAQLPGVFLASDVFVFPTLLDGFGMVILEAMAAGLPVIATPHCAAPDLIQPGTSGLIVSAGDVQALVEAMRTLADDQPLRNRMGLSAQARAREYSWHAYGQRCRNICQEVLDTA